MVRKLYAKEATGGGEGGNKSAAMPAILMAVVCLLAGCVKTLMSLDLGRVVLFIQQGHSDQLKAMLTGFAKILAHDSVEQVVGIILIIVVLFLRKKYLAQVKYKDLFVLILYFVFAIGLGRLATYVNHLLVSEKMSHLANVAIGEKTSVLAMFTVPQLINWIGLSAFIFARTGAKKLGRTLAGGAGLVSLVLSVALGIFAGKILNAISMNMPNVINSAIPLTRLAFFLDFVGVSVLLFFWIMYGESNIRLVGASVFTFIQPLLSTLLGAAFILVGSGLVPDKGAIGAALAVTGLGTPIAYTLGAAYIVLVLFVKTKREKKKAVAAK